MECLDDGSKNLIPEAPWAGKVSESPRKLSGLKIDTGNAPVRVAAAKEAHESNHDCKSRTKIDADPTDGFGGPVRPRSPLSDSIIDSAPDELLTSQGKHALPFRTPQAFSRDITAANAVYIDHDQIRPMNGACSRDQTSSSVSTIFAAATGSSQSPRLARQEAKA